MTDPIFKIYRKKNFEIYNKHINIIQPFAGNCDFGRGGGSGRANGYYKDVGILSGNYYEPTEIFGECN